MFICETSQYNAQYTKGRVTRKKNEESRAAESTQSVILHSDSKADTMVNNAESFLSPGTISDTTNSTGDEFYLGPTHVLSVSQPRLVH